MTTSGEEAAPGQSRTCRGQVDFGRVLELGDVARDHSDASARAAHADRGRLFPADGKRVRNVKCYGTLGARTGLRFS